MNITIRAFVKKDIQEVEKLLPEMWFLHSLNSDLVSKEKLERLNVQEYLKEIIQKKNQKGFVAVIKNKIVGFIQCEKKKCPDFYKENKELYLDDLIVLKDYRNKGIATANKIKATLLIFSLKDNLDFIQKEI